MGLFSGPRRAEVRAVATIPDWGARVPVVLGDYATMDPSRLATAAQSVAVRATVDLIASLTSELPVQAFGGTGRRTPVPSNVLDPAGDGTGVEDWLYRLLVSLALTGNAFGYTLDWGGQGRYRAHLDLLNPDDVAVTIVSGAPQWWVHGRRLEGDDVRDFVHRRANPMPGRLLGLSPIEMHATQIGVSLSTSRFGRQWFTDGAQPSGLLTNETLDLTRDQEAARLAKDRFMQRTRGSREPLVLGKGWKWEGLQITPEESQFLETQRFSEAQCARMFGPAFAEILGYETGGSMTYQNVVDRRQDLLVLSMNRWIKRAERALSLLVPAPQVIRLDRDALLETTTLQRYQAHASALGAGWKVPNEVREQEGLEPTEWGNAPTKSGGSGGNSPGA